MELTQGLKGLKIALLIDFDNVILGVEEPGFDVELVVNALRSRGIVVMGRAYGDWYRHNRHRRKLMEQGIELVETPVFGPLIKNSADIRIVLDAFEIAMSQAHIDTFCLVSGDSDFLPLIKKLQYLGKTVIVIAGNKFTSDLVRRNCNEYVSYENLLAESVGATEDVSVLEGAYQLLQRTMHTLNERGMDIRSSTVKQMMLQLNPAFSERTFGCNQFKQFLDKAARANIVRLGNRDGQSGEYSVLLPSEMDGDSAAGETTADEAPRNGVAQPAPSSTTSTRSNNGRGERRRFPDRNRDTTSDTSTKTNVAPGDSTEEANEQDVLEVPSTASFQLADAPAPGDEATDGKALGAVPSSVFLNRAGLRRGRLRFSAKERLIPQAGQDGAPEVATPATATAEATPHSEAAASAPTTPEASQAGVNDTASHSTPSATSAAVSPDETIAELPFTPVAEEPAAKKRTSRNNRNRKSPVANATGRKTGKANAPAAVSDETSPAPTAPVAEARPAEAPPVTTAPTAATPSGTIVSAPTSEAPEQVGEEAAAKPDPARRRRTPRKKL